MKNDRKSKFFLIIKQHVINNKKEYIIVAILFIIGIFLGVLFINNVKEAQKVEIDGYFSNFIEKFKNTEQLNNMELIKTSIIQNVVLSIIIWFFGTTVIGIPVVFGMVLYRGFCLGYTISVCVCILGMQKGIWFTLSGLLLQNIIFIPAILGLAVSGFKLYKSIVRDNRRENIKIEIIRHTIFSIIMIGILIFSSLIETCISTNILKSIVKYF